MRVYFLEVLRESRVDRELRNPFFIVAMIFALAAGGVALALWAESSPARWIGPRSLWWLGGYLLVILAGSWAVYRWRRVRNEKRLALWEKRARESAARPGAPAPEWIAAL